MLPPAGTAVDHRRDSPVHSALSGVATGTALAGHLSAIEALTGAPLSAGNEVTLLRDGPETIASMEQAVREATDHINVETFIFRDDEVGRPLADLLLKKSAEGVQVNLIYDSYGGLRTSDAFFARLRTGGVAVLEFNPIDPFEPEAASSSWSPNNRTHRKLLVVDGRIGFTGGVNFHREYSGSSSAVAFKGPDHEQRRYFWRDTHLRIEGPAVAELQQLFVDQWRRNTGGNPAPADYFPALRQRGSEWVRIVAASPQQPVSYVYAAYLSAIRHAQSTIHLTHAYLIPTDELLQALKAAARSGVDVRIVLPGFSDFWLPRYAGRFYYDDLLEAGVRLYERQNAMLHAKAAVIDGVWSTVGSSNLDLRSALHDEEVNAVIVGAAFGREMEELFTYDVEHSKELRLAAWRERPWRERAWEWVARLFKYWL